MSKMAVMALLYSSFPATPRALLAVAPLIGGAYAHRMSRLNAPGWLIVVEGIDGAGKSTVLGRLADHCAQLGLSTVRSAEPTRGQWGARLRESMSTGRLSLDEELDLFLKDRAEHVAGVIRPALARGAVVLLDRYYLSTAAYQGARGADPERILIANEKFAPKPDLVLLLDFDPAGGLDRIRARGDSPNTFEQLDSMREVRRIFLEIDRPFIHRVDAAQSQEKVWEECRCLFDSAVSPKA
jgi:dTMP kinase